MFLSIIIPVYKVEKYLRQCVDSIISQNLKDIEIILVDDGSPDNCPIMCDEYAKEYSNISVIHKPNGGLSSARNTGIDNATGEYIMFLDSDDWWNPSVNVKNILESVHSHPETEMFLLSSLDYIEGMGFYKRKEHQNLSYISTDSVLSYYNGLLNNGNLEVHAATKILKTSFIKNNNLYFKKGICGEDNEWMIRILRCLNAVQIINEPIYIYRSGRVGSITNTIKIKNIQDLLEIINDSIFYHNQNPNFEVKNLEFCFCAYLWFTALGLSNQLSTHDKNTLKPLFKETAFICKYSNSPKTKLAYTAYKLLGLTVTSKLLGKYINLKSKKSINKTKVDDTL